jgi:hypothetical protein
MIILRVYSDRGKACLDARRRLNFSKFNDVSGSISPSTLDIALISVRPREQETKFYTYRSKTPPAATPSIVLTNFIDHIDNRAYYRS